MSIEMNVKKRDAQGTGASRRLRRADQVPAIIYGGDKPATPITLDHNEIFHALRKEAFHASVLTLNVEGTKETVLLRDTQMHAYKLQVLHVTSSASMPRTSCTPRCRSTSSMPTQPRASSCRVASCRT